MRERGAHRETVRQVPERLAGNPLFGETPNTTREDAPQ